MGQPHTEIPVGTVDGVNDTFFTSIPYLPGSLALFFNGMLMRPGTYIESDPSTGEFRITEPTRIPRVFGTGCDSLIATFFDTNDDVIVEEVVEIAGSVSADAAIDASVQLREVSASIPSSPVMSATVGLACINATVSPDRIIRATIKECSDGA